MGHMEDQAELENRRLREQAWRNIVRALTSQVELLQTDIRSLQAELERVQRELANRYV